MGATLAIRPEISELLRIPVPDWLRPVDEAARGLTEPGGTGFYCRVLVVGHYMQCNRQTRAAHRRLRKCIKIERRDS